ncbi:hypothetical protein WICPIJ_009665 [Wickerhamomyces pijperi]|uniref:Derlin n=2 Tax=Wickerhamomyces pijperi TaxID=599730 RepID=A0A9P8PM44_WICPI|nr:hypothetical protein WICPIJ_009665 [Wickerhamomyces pijperi]
MSIPPSGFRSLPISKILIVLTATIPLISSLASIKYLYYLSLSPFISEYQQYWRILSSQISFINESEVLLAVVLLYQFRAVERFISSYRYLSMITVFWCYNSLLITLLIGTDLYLNRLGLFIPVDKFPSGPFAIITGLYAIYKAYIPVTYTFDIYHTENYKITLNDQILVNLLTLQLTLSQGWCSIWTGFMGYTVAWLVINGVLPGLKWRIPFYKDLSALLLNKTTSTEGAQTVALSNGAADSTTFANRAVSPNDEDDDRNNIMNRDEDEDPAETRPLASQFLDTFRR